MIRPYSLDLRDRAIAALEAGHSCRRVADRFGLAVSTVVKWGQRYRKTGTLAPGWGRTQVTIPHSVEREVLLAMVKEHRRTGTPVALQSSDRP
jgi:transposase